MSLAATEEFRVSRRLRDALVADLVMEELESDNALTSPLRDPYEWTAHLGRQLGLRTYLPGGIHETLLMVLPELEDVIRAWPPQPPVNWSLEVAHEATKSLNPLEVYATFLAGPSRWTQERVENCSVGKLHSHLRPKLERCLARELTRLINDWIRWDIPHLAERRRKAFDEATRARTEAEAAERRERTPRQRVPRSDRPGPQAYFRPPPKT